MKLYKAGTANIVATEGSITTTDPAGADRQPGRGLKFVLAAATATPAAGATTN